MSETLNGLANGPDGLQSMVEQGERLFFVQTKIDTPFLVSQVVMDGEVISRIQRYGLPSGERLNAERFQQAAEQQHARIVGLVRQGDFLTLTKWSHRYQARRFVENTILPSLQIGTSGGDVGALFQDRSTQVAVRRIKAMPSSMPSCTELFAAKDSDASWLRIDEDPLEAAEDLHSLSFQEEVLQRPGFLQDSTEIQPPSILLGRSAAGSYPVYTQRSSSAANVIPHFVKATSPPEIAPVARRDSSVRVRSNAPSTELASFSRNHSRTASVHTGIAAHSLTEREVSHPPIVDDIRMTGDARRGVLQTTLPPKKTSHLAQQSSHGRRRYVEPVHQHDPSKKS